MNAQRHRLAAWREGWQKRWQECWQKRWQKRWQQRLPRERLALSWLLSIVIGALAAQSLWSLEQSRRALARQVPLLAEQAERMRALREAWKALPAADSRSPAAPGQPGQTDRLQPGQREIEERWSELGKAIVAQWTPAGELSVHGKTDFNRWLKWVAAMHEDQRLIVSRCKVTALADGGVEIEASLAPAAAIQ